MITFKGLGRITEYVTPISGGNNIRSLMLNVVFGDGVIATVKIETQDPDMDFHTAAVLDENLNVEVTG